MLFDKDYYQAKKNNCCVVLKWDFWKSWVGRSENYFFFNIFFKKHPKGPNLGAFSIIFLKKKTPNLSKIGCFPDPTFLFLFLNRVGRWGQHNIFFLGLIGYSSGQKLLIRWNNTEDESFQPLRELTVQYLHFYVFIYNAILCPFWNTSVYYN